MSVHRLEAYYKDGKYYCIECNEQIIAYGHSKGCRQLDTGKHRLDKKVNDAQIRNQGEMKRG